MDPSIKQAKPRQVLLLGRDDWLMWFLPSILSRAGCVVDVLTSSHLMRSCRFVRHCEVIPPSTSIVALAAQKCQEYDWIVITEDHLLHDILHSDLSTKTKLKLLPVLKEENFSHLYSKISLSKIFSNSGVKTPAFFEATNHDMACEVAQKMQYPVLLKLDASGGGSGIFECHSAADIKALDASVWLKPVLIQKMIAGTTLDLSALFLDGELIHFSYSIMEKVVLNRFGPSVLRNYHSLATVDPIIFDELRKIGKALGAHGFTNITCIEASDGSGRYYFEADMRPNVWVDASIFLGEDIAERISSWFSNKRTLQNIVSSSTPPSRVMIPYFLWLSFFELLTNRYNVWKFIPKDNPGLLCRLFLKKIGRSLSPYSLTNIVKQLVPQKYHPKFKQIYLNCLKAIRYPTLSIQRRYHL
ncbi:MAG: hypothetical protein Q8K75_04365 [Chlamydiales bacterium]|nr:hypothetical protein [Chlamydiales bacterium]